MKKISAISMVLTSIVLAAEAYAAGPLYSISPPSAEQLDAIRSQALGRQPYALAIPSNLDTQVDGAWSSVDGQRIWAARLNAPGARSMHLVFEVMQWPEQAVLTVAAVNGAWQTQYRAADIQDGELTTALMRDDTLDLSWSMPDSSITPRMRLKSSFYGLDDPRYSAKHGACNNDVICAGNETYADQIDSTVLLLISEGNFGYACSGLLVNNARNDRTPYILTADHCGITRSNDQSVQVFWRYEDDQCGVDPSHDPEDPNDHTPLNPNFAKVGVELLADGSRSDFTLLVAGTAANPFVIPNSFQPYWSGWDVSSVAAQSGVSVHHPSGFEKSISFFNQPVRAVRESIEGVQRDAWRVVWSDGTTEPGSSGSGLWNQDQRVVGVLSGGAASCSDPSAPDLYGRLNVAWQEEPTCDRQLKFWLDPDFSDRTRLNGVAPGTVNPQVPTCVAGTPVQTPAPSASPTPAPTATPLASATPSPTATAQPTATPTPVASGGGSGSLPLYLLILLGLRLRHIRIINRR